MLWIKTRIILGQCEEREQTVWGKPRGGQLYWQSLYFSGQRIDGFTKNNENKDEDTFLYPQRTPRRSSRAASVYDVTQRFFHGQKTYKRHSEMRLFHCHRRSSSDGQKKHAERHLLSARHLKQAKRKQWHSWTLCPKSVLPHSSLALEKSVLIFHLTQLVLYDSKCTINTHIKIKKWRKKNCQLWSQHLTFWQTVQCSNLWMATSNIK